MSINGLSVLIIDDNAHMLKIISAMVKGFGVSRVFTAQDPVQAFELLKEHPIDVALVDFRLPVIDGLEFTHLVRNSKDSPDPFLPIIMITAHSEKEKIYAARDIGVTEFCCKPLTANTLYKRFVAIVNHNRPYIRTANYFGPDRRRRKNPDYKGPERRVPEDAFAL